MAQKRQLISFFSKEKDFEEASVHVVNPNGPTLQYHHHFWEATERTGVAYERHVILATTEADQHPAAKLAGYLNSFMGHRTESHHLAIQDPGDLAEVKDALQQWLLEHPDTAWDFYMDPGDANIQLAWYICHTSLRLDSRLVRVRPHTGPGQDALRWMELPAVRDPLPVHMALRQAHLKPIRLDGRPEDRDQPSFYPSASLEPVYQLARRVAAADRVTVLIHGESGTGKENLARTIHQHSLRGHRQRPFMSLNCSALGDELLEIRLFGYVRGAFPNALNDTPGIIEKADGGSLFLDEIGNLGPYIQRALLRFLQEGSIQRVGSDRSIQVDVRVMAATYCDLFERCVEGRFRWDLYYRLAVAELELPPLREWEPADRRGLFDHFIKRKQEQFHHQAPVQIDMETYRFLTEHYPYPGNVREMENLIEGIYATHGDQCFGWEALPRRIRKHHG